MSHAWHFVRVQLQGPTHSGLPKTRTRCSGTCLQLLSPNQNRARVGAVLGQCLLAQPPLHCPSPGHAGRFLP